MIRTEKVLMAKGDYHRVKYKAEQIRNAGLISFKMGIGTPDDDMSPGLSLKTQADKQYIIEALEDGEISYQCILDAVVRDDRLTVVDTISTNIAGDENTSLPVVPILTTPTIISPANSSNRDLLIQADSANTISVFIGGSDVTTLTGIELTSGTPMGIATKGALYGIASATGASVRTLVVS